MSRNGSASAIGYQLTYTAPQCPAGTQWTGPGATDCAAPLPTCLKDCGCSTTSPDATAPLVNNPCNAATGNKTQPDTDYPGGDGIPAFTRQYNSQLLTTYGLGIGWSGSAYRHLSISGNTVTFRRRSGRGESFTCSTSSCSGDADSAIRLIPDANGYTVYFDNGASERYGSGGALLWEKDRAGRTTSYQYNSSNLLATITGPFGHSLVLAYNSIGLVTSVTDPNGKVYGYTYDSNNRLLDVTYPDGSAKLYHYENSSFPNHLTGISYKDTASIVTRYSTYTYGTDGKAISTEHAGGAEKATLQYDSDTQTTVRDAINTSSIFTFQTNLGVKNLIAKLNTSDNKSLTQTFDSNNNITCRKDPEGRVTTYTYNSANQKLSMTEGLTGTCVAPQTTSASRTTTYQYLSATLDLPTVIQSPSVLQSAQIAPSHSATTPTAKSPPSTAQEPTSATAPRWRTTTAPPAPPVAN
ncbi:MAG: RHS repeat protein [Gammaproteobacteria bacterium]|nr:RHS repeat protein [Gammaproteobacteria bacterium]